MLSYFFSLKTGSRKKIPHPQIKIQSLSVSSFFLSYIALLNQDRARYTIVFLICLFRIYMRKPGIVVFRKLQSNALVRLQTIKKSLVQEGGMFGVLRKHCSEACGRRLCLVLEIDLFESTYNGVWGGCQTYCKGLTNSCKVFEILQNYNRYQAVMPFNYFLIIEKLKAIEASPD